LNVPTTYLLLAAVLVAGLSGGLGYRHGIETEQGRSALAMQDAIVVTHSVARADAEAESKRRQATALRDARRAAEAGAAKLRGQLNAARTARAECVWPADRVRDANDAIAAANADHTAAERVPDGLPAAAPAD